MAKLTPKTANELYYALTKQVIETANNAINPFLKRPSKSNLIIVENTLIDLIPFSELAIEQRGGRALIRYLRECLEMVQETGSSCLLNENEILSHFETGV